MHKYLILRNPGHNRVYYLESEKLALAELALTVRRFDQTCQEMESVDVGGVNYLSFVVEKPLSDREQGLVSNLSFIFALFLKHGSESDLKLQPLPLIPLHHIDPKISMLLKYAGKTNEIFTRMMINVAVLSSDFEYDQRLQLLDPVAGKGTTLYEASTLGFDVTGIEMERKLVHDATTFFKRYLQEEKYKHTLSKHQMYSGQGGEDAYIQLFEYARDKAEFKSESNRKHLAIIAGNAIHARRYFKVEKFHLIVGDLPYGIAHGNISNKKHSSRTRSPEGLMKSCLPDLYKILKTGGTLVLAWNKFVWSREDFVELLTSTGFKVLDASPYDQFTHRVDQSIKRDIVVAIKA